MNRHVNAIAGRLSLRPPQRRSLEILDRVTELVPPRKDTNPAAALDAIRAEFPSVTDFERDFPSLCFALATGVGKTRLMGAFISYLHLAHGINNFFVLAPNLTIYRKLITDFTPNTPKYVFRGIAEFATSAPEVITGDDYESRAGSLFDPLARCKVNVFNIAKITSEVRGGRSPRIKRLSEYIGESYFDYLAGLPDLVLLMDESHRYRASAVRAINELRPVLGLELTASPFVETARGPVPFRNVIYDYSLGSAMADGFVKEPAVVTRRNFTPAGMSADEIERLKLEDGVRLHESVKVELETYARETGNAIVKPFLLAIARDVTHARQLLDLVQSDGFFEGRYRDRVIQVDSSRTGTDEEEMIERLLRVEHTDEPTEIVIHVPFELELSALRYPAVDDELWIQHLRTGHRDVVAVGTGGVEEARPEDYVVSGLVDFDDVSYDDNADLLYALAAQTVRHFRTYLSDEDTRKVLRYHQREIARFVHVQMLRHHREDAAGYDVVVTSGATPLKSSAYTASVKEPVMEYRVSPPNRTNMARYLFGGFSRCLYPIQKFDSEPERKLAVILERESLKWFRPARGQFQILYRNGGEPWRYVLISHDVLAENMTLDALEAAFGSR